MIQRKQNIYLILSLSALAGFLLSPLPWASGSDWQTTLVFALGLSSAGLAGVALACFKIPQKQRKFVTIALVEMVVFAAMVYGGLYFTGNFNFRTIDGVDLVRLVLLLLPAAGYVFMRLALGAIMKDIKLLSSSDRVR